MCTETQVEPGSGKVDEDGPFGKRSCTDIPCCLLFLAAIGGMGYVVYLAFCTGDPYRLVYGTDSWGNVCGRKNANLSSEESLKEMKMPENSGLDLRDANNVFYYDHALMQGHVKVCVKDCMTKDESINNVEDLQQHYNQTGTSYCWYNIQPDQYKKGEGNMDVCPSLPIEKQISILFRCINTRVGKAVLSVGAGAINRIAAEASFLKAQCEGESDFVTNVMSDIAKTSKEILYMSLASIGISFVIMLLLRFFAAFMIWTTFIIVTLGSLAGAGYVWYLWYMEKQDLDKLPQDDDTGMRDVMKKRIKQWLYMAIGASIAAAITFCIMFVMRKRIAMVVKLFIEAGKALTKMPLLLLQPLWTLIALIVAAAVILAGFGYIGTAGHPELNNQKFVYYKADKVLKWWRWYYLFGTLWVIQFIFACYQIVVAGAVAAWYFARNKSQLNSPILSSIGRLIRYHLGSVAFGSLIVAIVQFARIALMYIQRKLRGRAGAVVDVLLKMLSCCLWCLEKVLKFLNFNAYIMIAIRGYSFCKAARKAFMTLAGNALRVAAINSVGTFTLFVSKLLIIAAAAGIGFFLIKDEALCYVWAPLVVIGIFSYLISSVFMGLYGMVIDTIFICFCEDCEMNDGDQKPYYMSKDLMTFVTDASNKKKAKNVCEPQPAQNNNSLPPVKA